MLLEFPYFELFFILNFWDVIKLEEGVWKVWKMWLRKGMGLFGKKRVRKFAIYGYEYHGMKSFFALVW